MKTDTQDGPTGDGAERVFEGVPVAPGAAIGTVVVALGEGLAVPDHEIAADAVDAELSRLGAALEKSRRQLAALKAKAKSLPPAAGEELRAILDAHRGMLAGSRLVRGAEASIAEKRMNADAAVDAQISAIAEGFEALTDPYFAARAADIREVGRRVLRNLSDRSEPKLARLPEGAVIVAEEITPAETALMDPDAVAGFAAALGGPEGHTAIMARTLGVPAVLGVPDLPRQVREGMAVVIDGDRGLVILDPSEKTLKAYRARLRELSLEKRRLNRLKDRPSITRDGVSVTLQANIELPRDAPAARGAGAAGIGLFRTEFLYMNRDQPPGEEEQYQAFAEVVSAMDGQPVTIRTLDVGGEKLTHALSDAIGGAVNPALGLRAIRLALKEPKLLDDQLAAILRAGTLGPVRILLPMITTPAEVRQVRESLARAARRLKRRRLDVPDPMPPLGVMIEVPGAALAADALAAVSDFFAIGTNDLTMYTLAIDRADEQVAHLYNPLHPAVLRLIEFAATAALRARIPLSVCGEMAGDPSFTALLLGLGIRELSMTPRALPRVKERILALDAAAATLRARAVMEQTDTGRIRMLLADLDGLA